MPNINIEAEETSILSELRRPWTVQDTTSSQDRKTDDLVRGRDLWTGELKKFLHRKGAIVIGDVDPTDESDYGSDDNIGDLGKEASECVDRTQRLHRAVGTSLCKKEETFPFLELPPELRNSIYGLYLAYHELERASQRCRQQPQRYEHKGGCWARRSALPRSDSPTRRHALREAGRRNLLNDISDDHTKEKEKENSLRLEHVELSISISQTMMSVPQAAHL
ncbi:hypothetical protein K458DRAFT_396207 [Lentithecium fluviatile CBS 122367]|uniref:Uncharacterized protein n=1 Tax=Lentithecium fluviatile CBS 122367 TaxID=1168545 RepID=A0A6G1IFX0_9PLEO|nr:hypothetical protein K458DRAFT_396207 [Lentithecium fluviatile CBS 122367]